MSIGIDTTDAVLKRRLYIKGTFKMKSLIALHIIGFLTVMAIDFKINNQPSKNLHRTEGFLSLGSNGVFPGNPETDANVKGIDLKRRKRFTYPSKSTGYKR